MQIEETMVDRLQRQRKGQPAVGLSGTGWDGGASAILRLNFTSHLGETCHRAYGHRGRILKFLRLLWVTLHWRIAIRKDAGMFLTFASALRGGRYRRSFHFRSPRYDPHGARLKAGARSRTRYGPTSDCAGRIAPVLRTHCRAPRWPRPKSGRARFSAMPGQSPGAGARHRKGARRVRRSQYRTPPEGPQ